VLDTLIANAVRLSGATRGHVRQFDGEFHRVVAHYGETAEMIAILRANPLPASPELPAARAHVGGKTIHILDVQAESGVHLGLARQMGTRTMLAVPLLREETNIGSLTIWRDVVEPFTERQMDLVKTFADQAVIAIENVRLSTNQECWAADCDQCNSRRHRDRLRHQPVLDRSCQNSARLCDAIMPSAPRWGDLLRRVAVFGGLRGPVSAEAAIDLHSYHRPCSAEKCSRYDLAQKSSEFPGDAEVVERMGVRTNLAVPLLREDSAIGVVYSAT
jgi:hypothetical protein